MGGQVRRLIHAVKIVNVFLTATVDGSTVRMTDRSRSIITKGLVNLVQQTLGESV